MLQPMSDYVQQLIPVLEPGKLRTLAVGHVVPDDNILPLTLSSGPTGIALDLRHGTRSAPQVMEELARYTLLNRFATLLLVGAPFTRFASTNV
jgi:chromosome transmission fidelity protein 1